MERYLTAGAWGIVILMLIGLIFTADNRLDKIEQVEYRMESRLKTIESKLDLWYTNGYIFDDEEQ